MTTDEIVSELKASVEEVYGDANALTIVESAETDQVLVMPPVGQFGPDAWEIAIHPGSLPLYIHVVGSPPTDDPRFQRAITDKLNEWTPDPERLSDQEFARLAALRARLRGDDSQ